MMQQIGQFVKENPVLSVIVGILLGSILFNAFSFGDNDPANWFFPIIGIALAYFALGSLV
jgi:hypothetical protein